MTNILNEADANFLAWELAHTCWQSIVIYPHRVSNTRSVSNGELDALRRNSTETLDKVLRFNSPVALERLKQMSGVGALFVLPHIASQIVANESQRVPLFDVLHTLMPKAIRTADEGRLPLCIPDYLPSASALEYFVSTVLQSIHSSGVPDEGAQATGNEIVRIMNRHSAHLGHCPAEVPFDIPSHPGRDVYGRWGVAPSPAPGTRSA